MLRDQESQNQESGSGSRVQMNVNHRREQQRRAARQRLHRTAGATRLYSTRRQLLPFPGEEAPYPTAARRLHQP